MKVTITNIESGEYDIRDKVDDEHVEMIARSLEEDGQWNPVLVRPTENGSYQMIAGHTRLRAAKRLGWDELDATVENVDEEEAKKLALKTNLKRKDMTKLEEGRVVNEMMNAHNLTQTEIADKLDKSRTWVGDRVRVALDLSAEVKGLVEENELSYTLASVVTQAPREKQLGFANALLDNEITDVANARKMLDRYLNDTIATVGYEGRDFAEFIDLLTDHNVDVVVDIRADPESNYKPEFNGDVLRDRLNDDGIDYRHESELGVNYLLRRPYKDGVISHDCFANWYHWWVCEESDIDLQEFTKELETIGQPALLCIEKHAAPNAEQDIHCHRDILADMIQTLDDNGRQLFPNRIDL